MHEIDRPTTAGAEGATPAQHLSALTDMEAIFGRPEPGRTAKPNAIVPYRPRRRGRPILAAVLLLAAMFGVMLFTLIRATGPIVPKAGPAPAVAARSTPRPLAPALVDDTAVQEIESVSATPPSAAASQAAFAADPVAAPRPVEPVSTPPAPAIVERRADAAPRPAPVAAADPCTARDNQDLPDCLAASVRRADFALRRAYYAAVEADVAPAALRHYRREWDRVRLYADEDPRGTIENYRGMARDLDELADRSGPDPDDLR